MDDKLRSGIRRQLEGLAGIMVRANDQEAATALVETCAALLRTYEKMDGAKNMQGDALEDVTDAFMGISKSVKSFADQLRADDAEAAEQLTPEGGADILIEAQAERDRMRMEREQLRKDLDAQLADNAAMRREVVQLKDEYTNACTQYRRMKEEKDSFYPDSYNDQMQQNARLSKELDQARAQMAAAQQEYARLTNELDEMKERIDSVNRQIAELPEEIRSLGEEFVRREQYLDRLRRAAEEFTPERKESLEKEIAGLEESNAGLERAVRELENTKNNLNETHTQLDDEQHRLQTDVLDRINACLAGLREAADMHKEDLDSVKKVADELTAQLEECEQLRGEYAAWLEADMSPIETVRMILSRRDPLDAELVKALDPTKDGRICELNTSVRKELEEMDRLLKECFMAAGRDRSVIGGKVRKA